jgi:hypothetical protein
MIWSARSNRYESMYFLLRRLRWLFEGPNSQNRRKFVAALNEDWISNQRIQLDRLGHFIQRCPQIRRSFTVANAKAVVCDVKLRAKNRARRSVQLYDESVPVKYDRWQASPIERVCDEFAGSTPHAATAISIKRRKNEAKMRSSSTHSIDTPLIS